MGRQLEGASGNLGAPPGPLGFLNPLLYDSYGWCSYEYTIDLARLKHPMGSLKRKSSFSRARTGFDKNWIGRVVKQFECSHLPLA